MIENDLLYPDFTWAAYRQLLLELTQRWHIIRLDEAAGSHARGRGVLILRHDVDFSPELALPMAEIESELGVRCTYFVALHLHYNPHNPLHARALRRIGALGHEIGLHYDSAVYDVAGSPEERLAILQQHVMVLQDICQAPISSIARHNPSIATGEDPFARGVPFLNAYDPLLFQDTVYLSDSCRAWRDGGLHACWATPAPARIYLLIHPEVWSDQDRSARLDYLATLRERVLQEHTDFFAAVQTIWQRHAGGLEHDRRTQDRAGWGIAE